MPYFLRTLDYGFLPIANSSQYLCNDTIDIIDCTDNYYYEVRKTLNGELVALRINN